MERVNKVSFLGSDPVPKKKSYYESNMAPEKYFQIRSKIYKRHNNLKYYRDLSHDTTIRSNQVSELISDIHTHVSPMQAEHTRLLLSGRPLANMP